MKVFLSSLIAGFGEVRLAAKDAIQTLRHEPVMAEDFGAQPNSPQIACLQGLRGADLMILVLGQDYGAVQPSGLSATHEEYREARGRKPVIAFVQDSINPGPEQAAFIAEVQGWDQGLFRGGFATPKDLAGGITRALYDFALANTVGPLDVEGLQRKAAELVTGQDGYGHNGAAHLAMALVGGPTQTVLRPIEIEAPALRDALHQAALFGEARVFERNKGVEESFEGAALVISQDRGASLRLNEQGAVVLKLPIETSEARRSASMPALIEEHVQSRIAAALGYGAWVLDHIDPTQKLSTVALAARLEGAEHLAWRTRAEQDASPNSVSMSGFHGRETLGVTLSLPRPALRLDRAKLVEDILVPLRRERRAA